MANQSINLIFHLLLSQNVLPLYFKHSKFASFVRQLNFYSFRKIRLDPDLNVSTKSVRFAHDYFRRGHPELLHRIQRSTRANDGSSSEIRTLKDELSEMSHQLVQLSSRMDNKLEHMTNAIEVDYKQRMAKLSFYYQELSKISSSLGNHPVSRPSSPPKIEPCSLPHSPRSTMCPLMTLSGVAAMIVGSEKADS